MAICSKGEEGKEAEMKMLLVMMMMGRLQRRRDETRGDENGVMDEE